MCQIIQTMAETAASRMSLTRGLCFCFKKLIRSAELKFRSFKICFSQDQLYSIVDTQKRNDTKIPLLFYARSALNKDEHPCTAVSVGILLGIIFHKTRDFAGGTAADQMILLKSE